MSSLCLHHNTVTIAPTQEIMFLVNHVGTITTASSLWLKAYSHIKKNPELPIVDEIYNLYDTAQKRGHSLVSVPNIFFDGHHRILIEAYRFPHHCQSHFQFIFRQLTPEPRQSNILLRLKQAWDARSDYQLAHSLNISTAAVYLARRRKVPMNWLEKTFLSKGYSLHWLYTGLGSPNSD